MLDGKTHSSVNLRRIMGNHNHCLKVNREVELPHTIYLLDLDRHKGKITYTYLVSYLARARSEKN